jgi:hypothetical protein
MKINTVKAIVERYCGEEISISDNWIDGKGMTIICQRSSFPGKRFCYIVNSAKRKVTFANSRQRVI